MVVQQTATATAAPSSSSLIHFKRHGNENVAKNISPRFYDELRKLLVTAGYAGLFKLGVRSKVPGRSHTKGLLITAPQYHGVLLTWHEGDNGNRIEMSLAESAENADGHRLFRSLKEAEKKLAADDGTEEIQSPAPDHASTPPSSGATTNGAPPAEDPSSAQDAPMVSEHFKNNREVATELFMEEAAKVADETGMLPKGAGFYILRNMGFPSPSPIIGSMVTHGDLIRIGRGWHKVRHQMDGKWIKRFPPKPHQTAQVDTVSAAPESGVAAPAAPTSLTFAGLVEELRRLNAVAGEISVTQDELRRIEDALARNAEERETLAKHAADLESRRDELRAQLASFKDAQAALEELKSILK